MEESGPTPNASDSTLSGVFLQSLLPTLPASLESPFLPVDLFPLTWVLGERNRAELLWYRFLAAAASGRGERPLPPGTRVPRGLRVTGTLGGTMLSSRHPSTLPFVHPQGLRGASPGPRASGHRWVWSSHSDLRSRFVQSRAQERQSVPAAFFSGHVPRGERDTFPALKGPCPGPAWIESVPYSGLVLPSAPPRLWLTAVSKPTNTGWSLWPYCPPPQGEVAQSCPTLCDPVDCGLPGSSIHRIFQARILEWVAISFSKGSSWPRDWIQVSYVAGRRFTIWASLVNIVHL